MATFWAATAGVVTVDVTSGPTTRVGCYAVVPVVTVDANPAVSVAGPLGLAGTTLIAGIDPDPHSRRASESHSAGSSTALLVTAGCVVAALLAVILRVAFVAWRERDGGPRQPPGGDLGLLS